ncbi:MAG: sigma-70 family RNA polymerase sigma factor [bacterium]|nr:sigma-70 family RNA polymerase sigma factor [bacterium]MCP5066813.1 sigma-70 family RNA polymerase sigma factor [bacterium]
MMKRGSGNEVHDRVQKHFGEISREARRMERRFPGWVSRDELESWGGMGLFEAARRFRPERGVPFVQYARHRVRGAMLDGMRETSWGPQSLWRARRQESEASTATLRAHAERLAGARTNGWLAEIGSDELGEPIALTSEPDPEARASGRELAGAVEKAVSSLPQAEATLIRSHVLADESLAEVAVKLGVSQPRAHQIRARALRRLAPRLRGLAAPETGVA